MPAYSWTLLRSRSVFYLNILSVMYCFFLKIVSYTKRRVYFEGAPPPPLRRSKQPCRACPFLFSSDKFSPRIPPLFSTRLLTSASLPPPPQPLTSCAKCAVYPFESIPTRGQAYASPSSAQQTTLPGLSLSFFVWQVLAAPSSSFLHAVINLCPPPPPPPPPPTPYAMC